MDYKMIHEMGAQPENQMPGLLAAKRKKAGESLLSLLRL